MKVGDFVIRNFEYPEYEIGRVIFMTDRTYEVKWSQNKIIFGYFPQDLLIPKMTEAEKMLWILENE